jgi:alpha-1,3-rhamnosyltransferase
MSVRFTLIVAAYDHERFIEAAVRSIRTQTSPFDRVVFFSDGSRDRTLELARSLLGAEPRVSWLDDLETNRGLVPRLIEAASRIADGYIMTLSADDVLHPAACQTFRAMAEARPFEWGIGATQITDEELRPTTLVDPTVFGLGENIFERLLKLDPWLPAQGWCYSAALLRRVGGYDQRHAAEDYSLGVRFARATKPVLTNQVISHWRVNSASYGQQHTEEMWADHARVALRHLRSAPRAALVASSNFMVHAAASALEHGRRLPALRHAIAAGLLRPDPRAIIRGLARLYARRRASGS